MTPKAVNDVITERQSDVFFSLALDTYLGALTEHAILWDGPPVVVWPDELDSYAADVAGLCGLAGSEAVVAEWLTDVASDCSLEYL